MSSFLAALEQEQPPETTLQIDIAASGRNRHTPAPPSQSKDYSQHPQLCCGGVDSLSHGCIDATPQIMAMSSGSAGAIRHVLEIQAGLMRSLLQPQHGRGANKVLEFVSGTGSRSSTCLLFNECMEILVHD